MKTIRTKPRCGTPKNIRAARIMKRIVMPLLSLMLLLPVNGGKKTPYHDFLLKDGRSFRGRIVGYNQQKGIVHIEHANKRLIKTSPKVFEKADQIRIKDWYTERCFLSQSLFKISAGRFAVKGKKWSTGGFDIGFGSSGGSSGYIRNIYYDIVMENRADVPFQNIKVEYRIYYSWEKQKSVKHGELYITKLDAKTKKEERTAEYIPSRLNRSMFGAGTKTVVDGIWIRVTLPLSNARKVTREYRCPDSIGGRKKWTDSDDALNIAHTEATNALLNPKKSK
jgi:hypothetical protein